MTRTVILAAGAAVMGLAARGAAPLEERVKAGWPVRIVAAKMDNWARLTYLRTAHPEIRRISPHGHPDRPQELP